jgi:hypothetical protein
MKTAGEITIEGLYDVRPPTDLERRLAPAVDEETINANSGWTLRQA